MKKIIYLLLALTLLLLPFHTAEAWNPLSGDENFPAANTIDASTPIDTQTSGPKWRVKFAEGTKPAYNSTPVITDEHIFIVCKNTLYQLDKGGNTLSTLTLESSMNSVCQMTRHGRRLFIPLGGGILQCVDTETMTSLWCSEAFGQQSLTGVTYYDGLIYAGTTNADGTDGVFYCLRETDGETVWKYRNEEIPCGYYWSGSICAIRPAAGETESALPENTTGYLLFGGDNGILISHSTTEDIVYDQINLSEITGSAGKIRAGITYDKDTDAYYTTSNDGYLYQIKLADNGCFESVTPVFLGDTPGTTVNCTSTPTIYNRRIYVGSYYGSSGLISVIDAVSMTRIYSATATDVYDIKSSPLVSIGYATEENAHKVYVYFTQNAAPGGIYYIEDDSLATSAQIKTLYEPKNNPQFCLSNVVADTDGTLYYSNDSGTFFAVAEGFAGNDVITPVETAPPAASTTVPPSPEIPDSGNQTVQTSPPQETQAPQPSPDITGKKEKTRRPKKPSKVVIKISRKRNRNGTYRVTFYWKKGKNTKKTLIKIKGRKIKPLSGTKKTINMKKGTYNVRFYGYQSATSKSSPVRIQIKVK